MVNPQKNPEYIHREHLEGEAVINQKSDEDGKPLSIKPIPSNLKPTLVNLAPLASENLSRTQSVRIILPTSSS